MSVPERMCRVCRTRAPKAQLQRWTLGATGFTADLGGHVTGRGAYTCSPECAAKLTKTAMRAR